MGLIDYSKEPHSDIAFFDIKSFYASVECIERDLNPLTTSLCVMSRSDNSKGIILASSPTFKQVFGKGNVSRAYDLPFHPTTRRFNFRRAHQLQQTVTPDYIHYIEAWAKRTLIVPPRMGLYIEKNLLIQDVLQQFGPKDEILPYSIDEGFIDLTRALDYFIPNRQMDRRLKLDLISQQIQYQIWRLTGLYTTIGMSNANPLLAKLALDNEAKYSRSMRANWSYEEVATKVWQLRDMTDFWGISHRTKIRLNRMGIYSIKELAHANPESLKQAMGIMGLQLFFHANGVDESKVSQPYRPKASGIGNAQILPCDYHQQADIELVLTEMAEQVAIRLRRAQRKTTCVVLYIGFSHQANQQALTCQMKVDPTQSTRQLCQYVLDLFRRKYQGGPVRRISIRYTGLVEQNYSLVSLFEDPQQIDKNNQLEQSIDQIRQRFGFLAIQKASALKSSSRSIARSKLIGGHSTGGLDGLS